MCTGGAVSWLIAAKIVRHSAKRSCAHQLSLVLTNVGPTHPPAASQASGAVIALAAAMAFANPDAQFVIIFLPFLPLASRGRREWELPHLSS